VPKRTLALLALWLAALPAAAFSLEELQPLLAGVRRVQADFVEERRLAILDVPLTSRGTLTYAAPGYLHKAVAGSHPRSFTVDDERLIIEQDGQRQELDLAGMPEVRSLVGSLRAILAGDFVGLARLYRLALEGEQDAWSLVLVPNGAPLTRFVERVVVSGRGSSVYRFVVHEPGGDYSSMDLEEKCRDDGC
jgi:hypothetical protein